jgi:uncharacterized phage-like protein YoqJ
MAMGMDTICAELVLELKADYPDIALTVALSSREQDLLWPQAQRERYARILERCATVHVISEKHTDKCQEQRERWMLENCDMLLAVWDGKPGGGAGDMVSHAKKRKKPIIMIDPFSL